MSPWIVEPDALLPRNQRIAVFAPHPDDFDAIGVVLRRARAAQADLTLAVMTTGASGVADADYPQLDRAGKARLRETEQAESAAFFGLTPDRVHFLRLDDRAEGELTEGPESVEVVRDLLQRCTPNLVCLPHPNDPNLAHQRTFALVCRGLEMLGSPAVLLLNRDPKTLAMRTDLYVVFGEDDAAWKRHLLRHHVSQQRRNLRTRGMGLDDRILTANAAAAAEIARPGYAEAFELRTATTDFAPAWLPDWRPQA